MGWRGRSRSNGFFSDPGTYEEAVGLWKKYRVNQTLPAPVFSPDGMLDRVCALLYGRSAGKHIAELNRLFVSTEEDQTPPAMWTKLYPLSVLWRSLAVDSAAWTKEISDPKLKRFLNEKGVDLAGYHRNMASRWTKWKEVTETGRRQVQDALGESDLKAEARADLEHLSRCLNVGTRFSDVISSLHSWLADSKGQEVQLLSLRDRTNELEAFVHRSFKTGVIDPSGGDIRAWLAALKKIRLLLGPA